MGGFDKNKFRVTEKCVSKDRLKGGGIRANHQFSESVVNEH